MEMGTITEWKVKEGDAFAAGDIICMVETDKVREGQRESERVLRPFACFDIESKSIHQSELTNNSPSPKRA